MALFLGVIVNYITKSVNTGTQNPLPSCSDANELSKFGRQLDAVARQLVS